MSPTEMAYRKTAVGGASGFGLLVALYDTLAGDLRRAAQAERANDLEKRTQELHHAILVVGYLEDWVSRGSGGKLSKYLTAFYRTLRRNVVKAQATRSAAMLEEQMNEVLRIRQVWQDFERKGPDEQAAFEPWTKTPVYQETQTQHYASSWSA